MIFRATYKCIGRRNSTISVLISEQYFTGQFKNALYCGTFFCLKALEYCNENAQIVIIQIKLALFIDEIQ